MPRTTWLLVNYSSSFNNMFPVGMAYISSSLKHTGKYSVHCLDLAFLDLEQHPSAVVDALRETGASVLAINGFSNEFSGVRSIIDAVRSHDGNILIIAGGHMVSSDPERIHGWLGLDYAVVGEGEETVVELAAAIASGSDRSLIPGIVYRDGDRSQKTEERVAGNNIDDIPLPDYAGFDLTRYLDRQPEFPDIFMTINQRPRVVPVVAARSCPFKCTFCSHSIKQYRKRSLDSIFAEIDLLVSSFGATGINIYDDLFATDAQRLEEFCDRIAPKNLTWFCQVRADMCSRELMQRLRSCGCTCISYGFESLDSDVLKSMKKHMSAQSIKAAARITYESKMTLQANFIFGDSAETPASIDKTLNWWAANRNYGVNLGTILVFPGTALYDDFVKRGVIVDELKYIENWQSAFVNGASISAQDYNSFTYGFIGCHSLTIPAHISNIQADEGHHIVVDVICPHCGVELRYGGSGQVAPNWVTCRDCFARFRIPVRRAFGRRLDTEHTEAVAAAILAMHNHKLAECKALLDWVTVGDAIDIDAINTLAVAQIATGELEAGMDLLRRALYLEPANAVSHNNYGVGLGYHGLAGWAMLHFKQAVLLDDHPVAMTNANFASDWLQKNFDSIPFVQKAPGYLNKTSFVIPTLSDGSSCVRRAPLRECLAGHPLGGLHL